ncbi:hypothetical protein [Undibacterium crateris]|uniref:hypothetical protein n=1 Tax=Undibacterium crateris TaxID=2528175 RepID=UPI0013894877|nr:hypothetical protein [Undibacterium crateris]NDI84560.1 hypothetical protein [Undibacterium crateris]
MDAISSDLVVFGLSLMVAQDTEGPGQPQQPSGERVQTGDTLASAPCFYSAHQCILSDAKNPAQLRYF